MSFKVTHDLHQRRFGRNLGVGLMLAAFIGLVFALTVVKVTSGGFEVPRGEVGGEASGETGAETTVEAGN